MKNVFVLLKNSALNELIIYSIIDLSSVRVSFPKVRKSYGVEDSYIIDYLNNVTEI